MTFIRRRGLLRKLFYAFCAVLVGDLIVGLDNDSLELLQVFVFLLAELDGALIMDVPLWRR